MRCIWLCHWMFALRLLSTHSWVHSWVKLLLAMPWATPDIAVESYCICFDPADEHRPTDVPLMRCGMGVADAGCCGRRWWGARAVKGARLMKAPTRAPAGACAGAVYVAAGGGLCNRRPAGNHDAESIIALTHFPCGIWGLGQVSIGRASLPVIAHQSLPVSSFVFRPRVRTPTVVQPTHLTEL